MLTKREQVPPSRPYALLPISSKSFALVDYDVYEWAISYHWRVIKSAGCSYVARRYIVEGRTVTIRLHVEIMNPPPGYEVHHKNLNPLDNRRENLENLTPTKHRQAHGKAY